MLYKVFALLALPVLIIQAKQVRKSALKLPEAKGERQGNCLHPSLTPLSVLIIGDSAAAGVGVEHQHDALLGQLIKNLSPNYSLRWQLVAKTGAQTQDLKAMLQSAGCNGPIDIVITSLGVNDVTSLQRAKHWLQAQTTLHDFCFNTLGAKHLVVSGMPPMHAFPLLPQPLRWVLGSRAKQFDMLQKNAVANDVRRTYEPLLPTMNIANMAEDGFHPGIEAYKEWAGALSQRIVMLVT